MRIIRLQEIDVERWDALVADDEHGPYDYSWYLDAVAKNWYIYVDENYTKGFAFTTDQRLGIENITVAPFVRENRFYGTWEKTEIDAAFQFLQTQFYGGIFQTDFPIAEKKRTYQIVRKLQLAEHARRNIKKAQKRDLKVAESSSIEPAFSIMCEELAQKINDFDHRHQFLLKNALKAMQQNNKLIIKEIRKENNVLGGLFFFRGKNCDLYLKGGACDEGKKSGGMYLAMQQQISETLAQGKYFDFDGSEVPGVKRFNEYFGTEEAEYFQLSWDENPWWFRSAKAIYRRIKNR